MEISSQSVIIVETNKKYFVGKIFFELLVQNKIQHYYDLICSGIDGISYNFFVANVNFDDDGCLKLNVNKFDNDTHISTRNLYTIRIHAE